MCACVHPKWALDLKHATRVLGIVGILPVLFIFVLWFLFFFPTPRCSLVFMCFIIFIFRVVSLSVFTQKRFFRFQDGYGRRIWITICLLVVIHGAIVYFRVSDGTNPWMKKTPQNLMEYLPPAPSN